MSYFHYRCGERITLLNDNCTAIRNYSDFDNGLVITAEPIMNDVLFEIKIDRKVNSWSGSLEIGLVECDPLHFDFPACSSKIQANSWIMSGSSFYKNGSIVIERYSLDLDKLNQDDRVGLMRTAEADLIFYINGESQGVAAENLPNNLHAVVDVYGKCVQVTITSPALREHNNDDCLSGSSVLAIENDLLNVTLGGDLSELSMSSSNSLEIHVSDRLNPVEDSPRSDRLHFHDRCGALVRLSNNNRSAERRRALDEFNNAIVMTHRALADNELFEIRIDRLVGKWSGSIEIGITTHNASTLVFPATMTNMRSGTIMMSGCGILTNGKGTRREYGDFNLDELSEGDRVGMMRLTNGDLHFFINGIDQGIAAQQVCAVVWGVIDLYGMTIKVSIVERDEREEQNLMTRKNTREDIDEEGNHQQQQDELMMMMMMNSGTLETSGCGLVDYYDRLTFHMNCGTHAEVVNNGRTVHRPNAVDDFNNGVVLTRRLLKTGEQFQVRLDRIVTKWVGSIEIGVTTHSPIDLEFPFTMTNVRSGTWMMTGSGIMHNGTIVLEQYGTNLDRLQVGDRVGVLRKETGDLHFFVNGIDQGPAASNIPEEIYGVIDLYGQAVEASIIDEYDYNSLPDTLNSSPASHSALFSDLRFHHVHGKNARIVNAGLTALRPRPLNEFNDAIIFSNRPIRDGELFEVCLDSIVVRWSGSIEIGVTAVRPDEIELPTTATDLYRDTWMLSGSSVMENGTTIKTNYRCDLDTLSAGVRIGFVRGKDKTLEFYRDGVAQGLACIVPHATIYAVIDLYGQCAQVSLPCLVPSSLVENQAIDGAAPNDLHLFSDIHGDGIYLSDGGRIATRNKSTDVTSAFISSENSLAIDELFEISIISFEQQFAGAITIGISDTQLSGNQPPVNYCYLIDNELKYKSKTIHLFAPSLNWLNIGDRIGFLRTNDNNTKICINSEELALNLPQFNGDDRYVIINLNGACNSVAVTSHKLNLEIGSTEKSLTNKLYEFSDNHGRNIELFDDKLHAKRVASYNQGLCIVQPCIDLNDIIEVMIEVIDTKWQSSIMVGIASGQVAASVPMNLLAFKAPCCILANDWISINGVKSRSSYAHALNDLKVGDKVGVRLGFGGVFLLVNGKEEAEPVPWAWPIGQLYAVFDLYGQCQQVKLLNDDDDDDGDDVEGKNDNVRSDFEKADLENCEKERLTLCLPSNSGENQVMMNSSSPGLSLSLKSLKLSCLYKKEVGDFKRRLLLPEQYFVDDDDDNEAICCFCENCMKNCNGEKDDSLLGWVKFPLVNVEESNQGVEKWHTAFYSTKIGAVRCILDKGQPLTKGQAQWSNFVVQREDDLQVIFHPVLQKGNGFQLGNKKVVYAAFQLLIKPSAYSVSRDTQEWCTKECGAIILHSLLIQISS